MIYKSSNYFPQRKKKKKEDKIFCYFLDFIFLKCQKLSSQGKSKFLPSSSKHLHELF